LEKYKKEMKKGTITVGETNQKGAGGETQSCEPTVAGKKGAHGGEKVKLAQQSQMTHSREQKPGAVHGANY